MTKDTDSAAILARALEAAGAATDAAHEAEAVILARDQAMQSAEKMVKRGTLLAAATGGVCALALIVGGALWARSAAELREANAVQATATAAFVERLASFNTALDRLDLAINATIDRDTGLQAQIDALGGMIDERLTAAATTAPSAAGTPPDMGPLDLETLRADILAAIAEVEISMAERLVQLAPVAAAAPAAAPAAPAPAPARPAAAPRPRAPTPPAENPFRFP